LLSEVFFMEIFKKIKGYPDYEVSNLGRVKSLCFNKERILKAGIGSGGYLNVRLYNPNPKSFDIHKLVAIAFLNHNPDGTTKIVVDHINHVKTDNRTDNLQLITHRKNLSKDRVRYNYSSKYVGVSWHKNRNKWIASIGVDGKLKHLGYFTNELEASQSHQTALKELIR